MLEKSSSNPDFHLVLPDLSKLSHFGDIMKTAAAAVINSLKVESEFPQMWSLKREILASNRWWLKKMSLYSRAIIKNNIYIF